MGNSVPEGLVSLVSLVSLVMHHFASGLVKAAYGNGEDLEAVLQDLPSHQRRSA